MICIVAIGIVVITATVAVASYLLACRVEERWLSWHEYWGD